MRRGFYLLLLLSGCWRYDPPSDPCSRYKAALLKNYSLDPNITPPPVNGSYRAYRCAATADAGAPLDEVLRECADYLNELDGVIHLGNERYHCKRGLLVLRDDLPDGGTVLSSKDVGKPCLARPPDEFSSVNGGAQECESLLCVVDRLDHDSSPTCTSDCATDAEVREHIYCTCRCEHPEGLAACRCPEGYSCAVGRTHSVCLKEALH